MASRVFVQRAAAPAVGSLLFGSIVLAPRHAFAEAPDYSKKPIYDDYDEPETLKSLTPAPASVSDSEPASPSESVSSSSTLSPVVIPSSTAVHHHHHGPTPTERLAGQIRQARLFLYRQAVTAEDGINAAADRVFDLERSFTATVASLAPARESGERLMPGSVYVLVAAMAGSMVTRRSNILVRAATPLLFGVGAGWALLPVTMRNVSDLAWTYEQRVPAIAQAHLQTRDAITRWADLTKTHAVASKTLAAEKAASVRETVEDWVKQGK